MTNFIVRGKSWEAVGDPMRSRSRAQLFVCRLLLVFCGVANSEAIAIATSPPTTSDVAAACRVLANVAVAPQSGDLAARRTTAQSAIAQLALKFPAVASSGNSWRSFLLWDETLAMLTAPTYRSDSLEIDEIESRWRNAPAAWNSPEMLAAAAAIQDFAWLLRSNADADSPDDQPAAWRRLADLVEAINFDGIEEQQADELAAALRRCDPWGDARPLLESISKLASRPNLIVEVPTDWLSSQIDGTVAEPYKVSGVYAGARTTGNGALTGAITSQLLRTDGIDQWVIRFQGNLVSKATGVSDGVRVHSRAATSIVAEKRFNIDGRGLVPLPSQAVAKTRIVYDNVCSEGGPLRRRIATRRAHERRGRAERDAASDAERFMRMQLDQEGNVAVERLNRELAQRIRDPLLTTSSIVVDLRATTTPTAIRWEYCVAKLGGLAWAPQTSRFQSGEGVTLRASASAIQELSRATFAGRTVSSSKLNRAFSELLTAPGVPVPDSSEFQVVFSPEACDVQLDDDQFHVTLHVEEFTSGAMRYPEMIVQASYKVAEQEGVVTLTRQGKVHVRPPTKTGSEETAKLGGRQQTLRLAVERKLGKVLKPKLSLSAAHNVHIDPFNSIHFKQIDIDADWVGFVLQTGSSDAPR